MEIYILEVAESHRWAVERLQSHGGGAKLIAGMICRKLSRRRRGEAANMLTDTHLIRRTGGEKREVRSYSIETKD